MSSGSKGTRGARLKDKGKLYLIDRFKTMFHCLPEVSEAIKLFDSFVKKKAAQFSSFIVR